MPVANSFGLPTKGGASCMVVDGLGARLLRKQLRRKPCIRRSAWADCQIPWNSWAIQSPWVLLASTILGARSASPSQPFSASWRSDSADQVFPETRKSGGHDLGGQRKWPTERRSAQRPPTRLHPVPLFLSARCCHPLYCHHRVVASAGERITDRVKTAELISGSPPESMRDCAGAPVLPDRQAWPCE